VEVESTGADCARLEGFMHSYDALIAFWRELMRHSRFRQLVYLEVYRMTHDDAGRRYPTSLPYFSTLEALVTGGYSGNYPTQLYRKSGFTFVEEFVLELDHPGEGRGGAGLGVPNCTQLTGESTRVDKLIYYLW
jgi:hypothetical protein